MSDTDPYAAPETPVAVEEEVVKDTLEVQSEPLEEVPDGPAKVVLAWVGSDISRASEALAVEKTGQKRTTLMSKLEDIVKG